MTFYYPNFDKLFIWRPYARLEMSTDNKTLTIFLNDFFTQSLAGKNSHGGKWSFIWHLQGNLVRLGYKLTHRFIGFDDSRMNLFTTDTLLHALLSLTNYPVKLLESESTVSKIDSLFNPNPWSLMDSKKYDLDNLISILKQQYPDLQTIQANPEPGIVMRYSLDQDSVLLKKLNQHNIMINNPEEPEKNFAANSTTSKIAANRALQKACENVDIAGIQKAVERGANVNHTIKVNNISGLKHYLNSSTELTPLKILLELTSRNDPQLIKVNDEIFKKGLTAIDYLLSKGADPKGTNPDNTDLHDMVRAGSVEIVRIILNHHPDLAKTKIDLDLTPLHIACGGLGAGLFSTIALIKLLLDAGVEIDAKDVSGKTAACYIAQCGKNSRFKEKIGLKILTELTKHNADLTIPDSRGISPLSVASFRSDIREAILAGGFKGSIKSINPSQKPKIYMDEHNPGTLGYGEDGEMYTPFHKRHIPVFVQHLAHQSPDDSDIMFMSQTDASMYGVFQNKINEGRPRL